MATPTSIRFEALAESLKPSAIGEGPNLSFPPMPIPFVPPTVSAEYFSEGHLPLTCEVVILTAPAAVGKSTLARGLCSSVGIPLLDLARVRVATHSLRGILSAEMGPDGPLKLQKGEVCIVVDALDEGRLLSGDKNLEEFLVTAFQLLLETRPSGNSKSPRLIMFGRQAATDLAIAAIDVWAPALSYSALKVDYFEGGSAPNLLAAYSRQPFLWRFFERLVDPKSLIGGDHLSYLLGSYWSHEVLDQSGGSVNVSEMSDEIAQATVESSHVTKVFQVLPPVALRREVRNLVLNLPNGEVIIGNGPDNATRSIKLVGDVRIEAKNMRLDVDRVQVGEARWESNVFVSAQNIDGDVRASIDVQSNSAIMVGASLVGRYPWDSVATPEQVSPPDDPIRSFLLDCSRNLPGKLPVVVFPNFEPMDDARSDWARRHGELFPQLLHSLVNGKLARVDTFPSSKAPKVRVRPECLWSDLHSAYVDPERASQELRSIVMTL